MALAPCLKKKALKYHQLGTAGKKSNRFSIILTYRFQVMIKLCFYMAYWKDSASTSTFASAKTYKRERGKLGLLKPENICKLRTKSSFRPLTSNTITNSLKMYLRSRKRKIKLNVITKLHKRGSSNPPTQFLARTSQTQSWWDQPSLAGSTRLGNPLLKTVKR